MNAHEPYVFGAYLVAIAGLLAIAIHAVARLIAARARLAKEKNRNPARQ